MSVHEKSPRLVHSLFTGNMQSTFFAHTQPEFFKPEIEPSYLQEHPNLFFSELMRSQLLPFGKGA